MANKNRVVGQCKVTANGKLFETDGSTTMDLGGPKREPVQGDHQAGAFRETTEPSKTDLTILLKADTSLKDIQDMDNVTLVNRLDIGTTYQVSSAYCAEVISFSTSDGKAKVVMMGPPAEEVR